MTAAALSGLRAFAAALAAAGWLALAAPAAGADADPASDPAAEADLARIVDFLNGIRSLKARFVQVAPDGGVSEGEMFMRRPGRLRFAYDPPMPLLMVADGLWLVLWDKELDQIDRVPLASTPLGFLVRDEVSFGDPIVVRRLERQPGLLSLTVFDRRREDEGELTLVFTEAPLSLRQWLVTDAQRLQTRVSLFGVETNIPLDGRLFVFTDEGPGVP